MASPQASLQMLLLSDHGPNALLHSLFQPNKSMAIVLPQQLLSLLVRHLRHVLTLISILSEILARLKLPKHC